MTDRTTKLAALVLVAIVTGFGTYLGLVPLMTPTNTENNTTSTTTTPPPTNTTTPPQQIGRETNPDIFTFEGVELMWIIIGGFKLKFNQTVVYIDPYNLDNVYDPVLETADYIIVTHDHGPHFSFEDIQRLSDNETIIISSRIPAMFLSEDYTVYPDDVLEFDDVTFEFVPSYNVNKFRVGGALFHPPEYDYVGVIVEFNGTRIYHAGDSDRIPEMTSIVTDIALLPVSGYAWMEAEEAAAAAEDLMLASDLSYAIPIHWGYNVGSRLDAERFVELANCTTMILEKLFERY
ncbi:MAG: MBL fold metallo-hydrolase [Candidatus Thorarchaeota archaeon]|jgi:L-ascorbate metabolism protein UlaG (beta-lactamase superfamily)